MGGTYKQQPTVNNTLNGMFSMFQSVMKPETQPRTTAPLPNVTSTSSSGDFFIRMSLDLLSASRIKNDNLRQAIQNASSALDHPESAPPLQVFKPFQLACQSGNPELSTIAIDCLGKLFTYNYWKFAQDVHVEVKEGEEDNDGTLEMITFVIDTICDTFVGESTDEKVQLQIIKVNH
jgi:brefeldin A-inhibited guanine nucleotide-exchange protein